MAGSTAAARTWQALLLLVYITTTAIPHLVSAVSNLYTNYIPLRPPAIPLAVRSPYLTAWSTTAGGEPLNSKNPIFYNGTELAFL
ncbi:hypothetical protein DOTSEDRAFT_41327 [Dothistroma septosporum NZE10]|uniref:Uncharacterized protein n=1 Tax=Dothistroma septosporum (strain NZE10 / CBS 128990) TaxID=675120 RepID=N1Q567_DOTSN|nr:hypothetical protein DOTSEDRAFT_41327 [Dothistroma septosporum NZE10]